MRTRDLHKNFSRHGLGIQRFLMESPLLLAGSSRATIQHRQTYINEFHSYFAKGDGRSGWRRKSYFSLSVHLFGNLSTWDIANEVLPKFNPSQI